MKEFVKRNEIILVCMLYFSCIMTFSAWAAQTAVTSANSRNQAWTIETGNNSDLQTNIDGKADALTADQNYVTDAQLVVVGNTSNTNTGDQDVSTFALKSNVLELDNTDAFTPDADYEPATKKYVDDNSGGGGNVSTSGTPVINDFAKFVDGTDIEGRSYAETKTDLSLDAVDNTSDADKPVSSAQSTAIGLKMALAGTETVTGDKTFSGTIGIGNLLYNAALGTDNTYSGQGLTGLDAGEAIAQWDLVYFDATAGEYLIADADATGKWPAWGMAVAAGTDGNPLVIVNNGIVRNDAWTWSAANVPLYLSDTTGGLTETAPATTGDCIQPVARTISADIIMLNVNPMYGYGVSN